MGVEHSIELWYDPSFAARKWTVRCETCGWVAMCESEAEAIHAREGHRENSANHGFQVGTSGRQWLS
jgi:hypothetical protein